MTLGGSSRGPMNRVRTRHSSPLTRLWMGDGSPLIVLRAENLPSHKNKNSLILRARVKANSLGGFRIFIPKHIST